MKKLPATFSNLSFLVKTICVALILFAIVPFSKVLGQNDSATFTATGTSTWVAPAGVTSATIRVWGAGGGGGGTSAAAAARGAGGGGGGGFSQGTVAVTPGVTYTVVVGTGGPGGTAAAGTNGGESYFSTAATIMARGGTGGGEGVGGGGGLGAGATAGVGTILYTGGNGSAGVSGTRSGAGGGGAGTTGNGGNAALAAGGTGTTYNGGTGATGRTTTGVGNTGALYGAGGGGGYKTGGTVTETGGPGTNGIVIVSWTVPVAIVTSVGVTNVSCNGASTGTATVNVSGGSIPYTYLWNDGNSQATETATGLSAGVYNVTVTDNGGISTSASATITQPNALATSASVTGNICNGASNGSVTASVSGGTSPFTYLWNDAASQATATATGLSAGTYSVVVSDSCGATSTASAIVTQPTAMSLVTSILAEVTCFDGNEGRATVSPSGGTSPYTYSWNTSNNQTTATATGLTAGYYTATVTDNCNTTLTAVIVITQPDAIVISANVTNIGCGGGTGSASVTVTSGGTSPFTYLWSDGNSQTTANATGLSAGTYTITVTDAGECNTSTTVTITQPGTLSVFTNITNVICNGNTNGSISASANGGMSPFTYSWSNGQTTSTAVGLSAGTYTITLTDNCGISASTSASVTQPNTLTASAGLVTLDCTGVGSVAANPNGGTEPYTYSWNMGATTDTVAGLTAGTYSVTVHDNNGCSATSSVSFTAHSTFTLTTTVLAEVTCDGGNNGRVTVSLSGGASPYTYSWNDANNQTTATATGLVSGEYTITVTDFCGSTASATAIVTQPTVLVVTPHLLANVGCTGGSTGSASVTASGGTAPYTYSWSNGATTTSISGVGAGVYTITVTDNNVCVNSQTITITQPATLTVSTNVTNVSCNGGNNGNISTSVSGGTAPFTYSWNNGQTTGSATNLTIGTYTVTVSDNCGSSATSLAVVGQPDVLTVSIAVTNNVICDGGSTGSLLASPSGGTAPYTYSWVGTGTTYTTGTITGLLASTYSVSVSDINGCTATAEATITQPVSLSASTSVSGVTCNGLVNGRASGFASGGTAPYTYSWNDSQNQTTQTATGLSYGSYTVVIEDICGGLATAPAVITQPNVLTASSSIISNVTCNGGTSGSASSSATGGTPPYTFSWSNGETTSTATGLSAGVYSITLTDNNGCSSSSSVSITQTNSLTLSAHITSNVGCSGGATGVVTASPSGGTTPYTYLWSGTGSQTTASATGLSAGTYSVTVNDNCGVTLTAAVTITQPGPISATTNVVTEVSCNGGSNGELHANVSGGSLPYTYLWGPGNLHTADVATGLSAGTYSVMVIDNCNDTIFAYGTITQPGVLTTLANTTTNVTCYEGFTGSLTAVPHAGTSPYTYLWSDVNSQTTITATGLAAGTYTLTTKDSCGASATATATITQPSQLAGSANITNVNCAGLGTAVATNSGGTSPYTYAWTPSGGSNATATGLSVGTYTITISDNCSASVTASVTVTTPPAISVSASTVSNISCNGAANGSVSSSPSGGSLPYTYLWSPIGGNASTATGLPIGTYTITVTDNCGNSATASASVSQPNILSATTIVNNVTCNGINNGNASASPSGGTQPYTYSWNTGSTSATIVSLSAGTYTVVVSDICGDQTTAFAVVTQPAPLSVSTAGTGNTCNGGNNGSATASVSGGTAPYTYSWTSGSTQSSATGLSVGTYSVTVTDNCGSSSIVTTTITQPATLSVSANVTNVTCNGSANGTATASVSGGAEPFTYLWSDAGSQATVTATGLAPGTYTVTVSDNCANSATTSVTITEPTVLTASANGTNVTCFGANTGTATASPSGGTSPYIYLWNDGSSQTTITAINLSAGTYSVTVSDNNGCSTTASVTLSQPATAVGISIASITNVNCAIPGNAIANAATGGVSPYTYSWSNGEGTNLSATGLSAGTYTITATDSSGCNASVTAIIASPATTLGISIASFTNVTCTILGSATANAATGGTSPYTYSWSSSEGSNLSISGLSAGVYTITATDSSGCIATASVSITQPLSSLGISINTISNVACNGGMGSITANNASGGTSPYTYMWSDAGSQTSLSATGLSAGTYTITVTDSTGCISAATAIVTQPASSVGITIASHTNVNCNGGTATASSNAATGGSAPYTYSWSPAGGNGLTASNLGAGTYTITATDNHGCTAVDSVTITQPAALGVTISTVSNISCYGDRGSATANAATGGTSPFTYSWSSAGGSNLSASNLVAGTYTLTAKDANGCTTSLTVTITTPSSALFISLASHTSVSCNGGSNGSATAYSATGGTGPYTYNWTPSGGTDVSASNLSAGIYTITVTDNNGCSASLNVNITQPATAVGITIPTVTGVSCYGGDNGKAIAHAATGGTAPYIYSWSPIGGTSLTASNLSAGVYTITTTDNNGCTASASVTITQPAASLGITLASQSNVSCYGGTGTATANDATGGTSPYAYHWTPSGGTNLASANVSAGTYTLTTTDYNGCTASLTVTITQPISSLSITMGSETDISCNGGTGSATSNPAAGGTSPYAYNWTPSGGTNLTAANLSAGIYTITVTDNNGCTATAHATITQPAAALTVTTSSTNETTPCNGTATVTPAGGTAPYFYNWTTGGQTTARITGQCYGTYCCVVTDNHGCSESVCVTIKYPTGIENISNSSSINVYPNPTSGQFTVAGVERGMMIEVYDYTGRRISVITANDETMQINIANESNGIYLIRIVDKDGNLIGEKKMVKVQ